MFGTMVSGGAGEEQGVAVWRRGLHLVGGDYAACAWDVLDDQRLAELRREERL